MIRRVALAVVTFAVFAAPGAASADVVTDWNRTMVDALEIAKTTPPPSARVAAIVQSAVFDAVNGIARRYTPVHVAPAAPRGASRAAAVASAAHEALLGLFPAQQAMLDQRLADTLAQTPGSDRSIALGVRWGKSVADQILAWRATDHFTDVLPPYVPAGVPGRWQPTPPLFGPPLFRQFAIMTPFALRSPSLILPPPPPPLNSARYARDFNEVKVLGSANSTVAPRSRRRPPSSGRQTRRPRSGIGSPTISRSNTTAWCRRTRGWPTISRDSTTARCCATRGYSR